jgi:YQGE family putative transporter
MKNPLHVLGEERRHFQSYPLNMRILLLTNLIYALVLPLLELFVGAYILRESGNTSLVVIYQLAVYTGILFSFLLNGYLLRVIPIAKLYSFGMLMSGAAMTFMMFLPELHLAGIAVTGLLMGTSYGFFWSNRDFLSLNSTDDTNRNYYFSLETVFYTLTFIVMPLLGGFFISVGETKGWYPPRFAYWTITVVVFALTVIASWMVHCGSFRNPPKRQFVYFRFHRDWYWMLFMGACKGVAQAAMFFFPVLLIMGKVGNEGSLGLLVSGGALISALVLYLIGRFSKPAHRVIVFGVGLLVFLLGGVTNMILFSAVGVIIYKVCDSLARPLLDAAYFPMQMRVIDHLSAIEHRNAFAYLFNHEFGLYAGRLAGCVMFLVAAKYVSPEFALRYVLVAIAVLQALSLPVARMLMKKMGLPAGSPQDSNEVLT